jgi:hypothetical protein
MYSGDSEVGGRGWEATMRSIAIPYSRNAVMRTLGRMPVVSESVVAPSRPENTPCMCLVRLPREFQQ